MDRKYWLFIFVPVAALITNACSAASAEVLVTESPQPESVEALVVGEKENPLQGESDLDSDQKKEPTDTPSAEQTSIHQAVEDSQSACEDPFDGVNIRFSPAGWETDFCTYSVNLGDFLSGGPPRDGIPPIDFPTFESLESAEKWLGDREPVIALELNGESRAYPLQILIWHEIVNDTVGGIPVVVTFCPLCNTALVFERPVIDGELLTFGTSGNLRNSDLVMWDRQTESWWQQFTGDAIVGELTGTRLEFLATSILSWGDYKGNFPGGQVLSKDTGFNRNYGLNPYAGYDDVNIFPFLFDGKVDDRLLPMTRVLGVELDKQGAAYVYDRLIEDRAINDTLGENPIAAFWKAGTASAVDASSISEGRDVGTTGVFLRTIDGQVLTFSANDDGTFRDSETGSTWDILGEAISGSLVGKNLTPVPHHDTFWFAWAAFVPDGALTE
jgi:hypothetical protein